MRGFTSLAERLAPGEVAQRLNRFYALASKIIFAYDGTLDKLVGDQVMAFFGAPLDARDHPNRAVHAALEILRGISGFAPGESFHVGAGIATGEAFVGNVGEGAMTDYTVLGDTVNVAALCKGPLPQERYSLQQRLMVLLNLNFPMLPAASSTSRARARRSASEWSWRMTEPAGKNFAESRWAACRGVRLRRRS